MRDYTLEVDSPWAWAREPEGVGGPQSQGSDGDVDLSPNISNIREIATDASDLAFDPVGWLMNGAYEAEYVKARFDTVYPD